MIFPDIAQYRAEKKRWKANGSPMRSDDKVIEIYDNHCRPCENYISITENVGQCGVCSCLLRRDGDLGNKIRWATTRCPLDEPKWVEEPGYEKGAEQINVPAPPPDCGCTKK